MVDNAPGTQLNWIDKVKSTLHLDKLQLSTQKLVDVGIFFGAGLIFGYLLKRFSMVLLLVIITIVALLLLHQFEFINLSVNADKIRELIGLHQPIDGNWMSAMWIWSKKHIFQLLSFAIGFLIGIRLG